MIVYKLTIKDVDGNVVFKRDFDNEQDREKVIDEYERKPQHYLTFLKDTDK
jgi:hypothetical protein